MELNSRYKHTDVGIIPEDWYLKSLGELSTLMTNGFVGVATSHYVDNENGVLYIQGYNVEENSFNFNGIKYVSEGFHKAHLKSSLREGDLLTVQTGDVGLTTVVTENLVGSNCHALIITRFDRKKAFPKLISYYLNSVQGRSRLKLIEIGTTMKHLNVSDMLQFNVPLPSSMEEQEAIAEALTDADALIESLEKLIEKKRQIKQGMMQELLTGKKRLPGFSEEWNDIKLGELGTCHRGVSYDPSADLAESDTNTSLRLLRSNNVQEGKIIFSDMQFVNSQRVSSKQKLKENDVLICMANGSKDLVGKSARFKSNDGYDYTFGAFMGCFRPNEDIEPDYVFYLFYTKKFLNHIGILLAGSSINNLTPKNIEDFIITLPSDPEEQKAIAEILSNMDSELFNLEQKLTKALRIKQGMMQELLTGRIRLV